MRIISQGTQSASFVFILPSSRNHHQYKTSPQGTHHLEIPGYADIEQQQGDLLTSFGSIDMAGLANHTSDFIGGFFGEFVEENDLKIHFIDNFFGNQTITIG